MTRSQIGAFQLTVGATMISFSAVFVKLAHVGPTMAGFYRMLFGGILLVIILLVRRQSIWQGRYPFLISFLCGVLFAVDLTFWHRSIHYVGPGLATLLANFQVIFLTAFGVMFLKEKLGWIPAVSIPLAIIGLFMIVGVDFTQTSLNYKIGVLFGLITALTYATFLLAFRKLQSKSDSFSSFPAVTIISLTAAVTMGLIALAQDESFAIPDSISIVSLVSYGFVGQVLGWVIISKGISKVESSKVGLILILQPTLSFIWDILFFGRKFTTTEFTGAILALIAICLGGIGSAGSKSQSD